VETSYHVHRAACAYFAKRAPADVYLGRFSIKKRGNIYGLIFGSRHLLGIGKFLDVAWDCDEIAGEANFDIERENVAPGEMLLALEEFKLRSSKCFRSIWSASCAPADARRSWMSFNGASRPGPRPGMRQRC